jgi:2-keto-4-pentenoate hydratase/2-oxohepta-3-ene-1,7-dioic acid hydratase in catechol pathway
MRIVRYLDGAGRIRFPSEQADDTTLLIEGDILATCRVTKETADIKERLTPIASPMIWCIGLNYEFHAQESNARIPEYPVLFAKEPNALQNPDDPIQITTPLRTTRWIMSVSWLL